MNFNLENIQQTEAKVKTGADFPALMADFKFMGISKFITFVANGNTQYFDNQENIVESPNLYDVKNIQSSVNISYFKERLKIHQNGKTDFLTFCEDCAQSGIFGWEMNVEKMTCTYFDAQQKNVLIEQIPT